MKKVAILVAAVVFTLSINTKVFATDAQSLNNTEVNHNIVEVETTQVNTTDDVETVADSTRTDTNISEVEINETGIMPDSILYFFNKAFDNLRLFFTFDDKKKIEILSQIADKRLAESEIMTQKEKYDLAKSTIEEFNRLITEASEKLNVLVEDNNNVILNEDKEMENKEVDLEHGEIKLDHAEGDKLGELEKNILSKQLKSIEVLKKLSLKLEGNAKEAIEAVIEMQLAKKVAVANMVEKRHELNTARQEYQLEKINLKQAKKSGNEEAIKVTEEVLMEKQSLYKDATEKFNIAFEEKKEIKNDFKKNVKKVENKEEQKEEVKEELNAEQHSNITAEKSSGEVTEQAKVVTTEKKVTNSENKNTVSNMEVKKVEEAKKVKEEAVRKAEEIKEKVSEIKESNKDKKQNKKN